MTKEELKSRFKELKAKLEEMKAPIKKDMNLFSMVGLAKQETKHSYFLTSLLNGDNPFGNITIELLCEKIWEYKHQYNRAKQNEEILKKNNSNLDMNAFKKAFEMVEVTREVHFSCAGKERFLDILITSKSSKSIMVLENKTESDTHDDQLCAYETYIDQNYADYDNKIFVFLSPNGEMPINKGGDNKYNDRWCIFDYTVNNGVLSIIETLINKIKGKQIQIRNSLYLRKILGDYRDMVDKELLKKVDVLKECWYVVENYNTEIKLIAEYMSIFKRIDDYLVKNSKHLKIDEIAHLNSSKIKFTTEFTRTNFQGEIHYTIEWDREGNMVKGQGEFINDKQKQRKIDIQKKYDYKNQTGGSRFISANDCFNLNDFFNATTEQEKIKIIQDGIDKFLKVIESKEQAVQQKLGQP